MSFASIIFLWAFLPLTLACYWIAPPRQRNIVLTAASLVFYAYGAHGFVFLLVALVAFNYVMGLLVGSETRPEEVRNWILGAAITVNVGVLVYWKYGGFLDQQAVDVS